MDEEKTNCTVTADVTDVAEESQASAKQNWFKRLVAFIKANENLRQLVLFTLFGMICFVIEFLSYTILAFCLKKVNAPIDWFVFHYSQDIGGLGAFIAFLVSNCLAQLATFILNRKKTFKSTNNVAVSGTMYAIVTCGIIVLNTWVGGAVGKACFNSISAYSPLSPDTVSTVCGYIGKLVGAVIAFVISFLSNKFLIMRNWGSSKKAPAEAQEKV